MRTAAFFAWLLAGCGLSAVGVAAVDTDAGPAPTTTTPDGSSPPANDASVRADTGSDAIAADDYPDCHALDDALSPPSGIYMLRKASAPFAAYCETQIAGGGWMLVGQSADTSTTGNFGWSSSLGDVNVESEPYSLNALAKGLAIHEILVASGTRANLHSVYVVKPADGFPSAFVDAGGTVSTVTKIMNPDCPQGGDVEDSTGPHMFHFAGWTSFQDAFVFRDNPDLGNFGLQRNHWQLNYFTCANAGLINLQQGLVFVR